MDGLLNGGNSPQFVFTSLVFFLINFFWIRFIMISKIKLKFFQINLMLELFMCLMLELL
jgi:hypothetical protein